MIHRLLILLYLLVPDTLFANALILTPDEKAYIKQHPLIKAHNELQFPPFNYNENGKAKGFTIEYMDLLAKKSGLKVQYISGYSWEAFMEMLKSGKLDINLNIVKNKEREKWIAFTPIYYTTQMVIYTHNKTNNIHTLEDLKGKTIAIPKGFFTQKYLSKNYPSIKQVLVKNQFEALKVLSLAKADATIGEKAVMDYLLLNNSISEVKSVGFVENGNMLSNIRMGVNKKDKILIDILTKAQKSVAQNEFNRLKDKWFGYAQDKTVQLTNEEMSYLKEHTFSFAGEESQLPFEAFGENGNYVGIVAEHIELLEKKLHTKFTKIKTKDLVNFKSQTKYGEKSLLLNKHSLVDIVSADAANTSLSKNYKAIDSYLKTPVVIVTKEEQTYIDDLQYMKDKKIALVYVNAYAKDIVKKYPHIHFIDCQNTFAGLQGVKAGQYDAFVGTLIRSDYSMRKMGLKGLKIVGQTGIVMNLTLFVTKEKPLLYNMINKAMKTISASKQFEIISRWRQIKVDRVIDTTLVWQISIVFLLFVILSFLITYFLKRSNTRLKKAEGEKRDLAKRLSISNDTLETRVEDQKLELERQYTFIVQQAKLASMGEMIKSIAHQWRQPLNRINSNVAVMLSIIKRPTIDRDILQEQSRLIEKNTKYMSETIDDFSNFFHPDKKSARFSIKKVSQKVLALLGTHLENIEVSILADTDIEVKSFKKEYRQVILIILNNAIDNFKAKSIDPKKITLHITKTEKFAMLSIADNGGGIEGGNINRIFEPYFSTKFAAEGTGLGLYVAKMLIESSMQGELLVKNENGGATFEIRIPNKENR